jgi:hypothetical protein
MSKTRLLLGASLIALAIGSISTVQAGFDRAQDYTANLGSNANAGAYYNPYLSGQNQGAPQQQTHANAQPNGYSLLSPFGFNIGPVGASSPWGGFSFGGFGPGSQPTGFNIGPVGASSPWGGFYLGGMEPALSHPGGFNIEPAAIRPGLLSHLANDTPDQRRFEGPVTDGALHSGSVWLHAEPRA